MAQTYASRGSAPQHLNLKKLPPGHMLFSGGRTALGLYVFKGHPYDLAGKVLPADISWLRTNGYIINDDIKRALSVRTVETMTKLCVACSAQISQSARFCQECGQTQTVIPDEPDEVARLIDPNDPLGSLSILDEEPPAPRMTPEEHFAALQADESRVAARELGVGSGLESLGKVEYSDKEFARLDMGKDRGRAKAVSKK